MRSSIMNEYAFADLNGQYIMITRLYNFMQLQKSVNSPWNSVPMIKFHLDQYYVITATLALKTRKLYGFLHSCYRFLLFLFISQSKWY